MGKEILKKVIMFKLSEYILMRNHIKEPLRKWMKMVDT